jgi:hypothetical protein
VPASKRRKLPLPIERLLEAGDQIVRIFPKRANMKMAGRRRAGAANPPRRDIV